MAVNTHTPSKILDPRPYTSCLHYSEIFYWALSGGTEKDKTYFKEDSSGSKMKEAFERGGTGKRQLGSEITQYRHKCKVPIQ